MMNTSTTVPPFPTILGFVRSRRRRDGFPDFVGIQCYQCFPDNLLREGGGNDCNKYNDKANAHLGTNITCIHGKDSNGSLVPPWGCYKAVSYTHLTLPTKRIV